MEESNSFKMEIIEKEIMDEIVTKTTVKYERRKKGEIKEENLDVEIIHKKKHRKSGKTDEEQGQIEEEKKLEPPKKKSDPYTHFFSLPLHTVNFKQKAFDLMVTLVIIKK